MDTPKKPMVIKLGGRKQVSAGVTAFMAAIAANSEQHPMNDRMVVIGSALVEILPAPGEPDTVWLKDLQSHAAGSGRAALTFLCGLADRHDVSISLCAKGYAHTPTVDLVVWYMTRGFVPQYDDINLCLDDVEDGVDMIRYPDAGSIELGAPMPRSPENTRLAHNGVLKAVSGIEGALAEVVQHTGLRIVADLAPALYGYFVRKGSSGALREWTEVIAEATPTRNWRYVGNCTSPSNAPYLEDMMDVAKEVSYKTLVATIGRENLMQQFPDFDWSSRPKGLTLANDYAVTYYKSVFRGHPCYYVRESGIEYIFSAHDLENGPKATTSRLHVSADGTVSKTAGRSLFSIERKGDTATISQSFEATKAGAAALRAWLLANNIVTVIENDDAQPVQEFIAWLDTVGSRDSLTEGKVEQFTSAAGQPFKLYINPTRDQFKALCLDAKNDLKAVLVKNGPLLVWNAHYAHHTEALGAWTGYHHDGDEKRPNIDYMARGNQEYLPRHFVYWLDSNTVMADGDVAFEMAKDNDLLMRMYPREFKLVKADYDARSAITVHSSRMAIHENAAPYLPPTSENIDRAKAFVLRKWKERAAERGHAEPTDLSSSCKFTSMFAHKIFGGALRGNYDHQFIVVDGEVIDLNVDASDVKTLLDGGIDPHEHDDDFWGCEDHLESMQSCQARVDDWVREFRGSL